MEALEEVWKVYCCKKSIALSRHAFLFRGGLKDLFALKSEISTSFSNSFSPEENVSISLSFLVNSTTSLFNSILRFGVGVYFRPFIKMFFWFLERE